MPEPWYYDDFASSAEPPASASAKLWSPYGSDEARRQPVVITPGEGFSLAFDRDGGEADTDGAYELRVFALTDQSTILYTVVASLHTPTGRITANQSTGQTALLARGKVYAGELWRTDGDDNTRVVASILIRTPHATGV